MAGITVSGGRLYFKGQRLRNIGINWGGAVVRIYSQPDPNACAYTPAAEQDAFIAWAQANGVKVVRIKAFPFWPKTVAAGVFAGKAWNVQTTADWAAHFAQLDGFLAKLKAAEMCAILTICFRYPTIPDLVGETCRQWLSTASNTWAIATQMTQVTHARYSAGGARADLADAVGAIAWGNETNHVNDISQADVAAQIAAQSGIYSNNPAYGATATYTRANDALTTGDTYGVSELATILGRWAALAAAADNTRLLLSGTGPCQYWRPDQSNGIVQPLNRFVYELLRDNPSPLNAVCMHMYDGISYCSSNGRGASSLYGAVRTAARQRGQAMVLEEFGNQPRRLTSLTVTNGVGTLAVSTNWAAEVGDVVRVIGSAAGTYDGDYPITALPGGQNAAATVQATGKPDGTITTGTARVQHLVSNFDRRLRDIEEAQVDLALLWCYESDPLIEIGQSITHPANAWQIPLLAAANARLASATW